MAEVSGPPLSPRSMGVLGVGIVRGSAGEAVAGAGAARRTSQRIRGSAGRAIRLDIQSGLLLCRLIIGAPLGRVCVREGVTVIVL
jgi:hypothetical protein